MPTLSLRQLRDKLNTLTDSQLEGEAVVLWPTDQYGGIKEVRISATDPDDIDLVV